MKFWVKVHLDFHKKETLKAVDQALLPRLLKCGALVEREMKFLLGVGGGKPSKKRRHAAREYWNSMRHGYVIASEPPDPPHTQTGHLKNAVTYAATEKNTVLVGPTRLAWYGKIHEHGGRNHKARPFAFPALVNMSPYFKFMMNNIKLADTPEGRRLRAKWGLKTSLKKKIR